MTKNALMVNLFGGPGTGKSTIAAQIFAELKWLHVDCEIVSEYAKQLVWERSFPKMKNQIYIFGKQHNKMWTLKEQVEAVVTDAPLLLGIFYSNGANPALESLVLSEHKKFRNLNIFLNRKKGYNPNGRTQTESEAVAIDSRLMAILDLHEIPYITMDADKLAADKIVKIIQKELKNARSNNRKVKSIQR